MSPAANASRFGEIALEALLDTGAIRRPGRGRPRLPAGCELWLSPAGGRDDDTGLPKPRRLALPG